MNEPALRVAARDDVDKPQSNTQRAVALLREMIITNQLPPGSSHLEIELADMLGMSRTPVREAALVLEGHGLVEVRPRRGVRVRPVSPDDMKEIYAILTELESIAARDVAERGCSPEEIAALRALNTEMETALAADDRQAWADADDRFHRTLTALAGNRRLEAIVSTFWDQAHRARMLTLYIRPAPHQSNTDHRDLVDAIERGDAEEARRVHRRHRIEAMNMMLDLIARHGFSAV